MVPFQARVVSSNHPEKGRDEIFVNTFHPAQKCWYYGQTILTLKWDIQSRHMKGSSPAKNLNITAHETKMFCLYIAIYLILLINAEKYAARIIGKTVFRGGKIFCSFPWLWRTPWCSPELQDVLHAAYYTSVLCITEKCNSIFLVAATSTNLDL